ncbi:MAG: ATP-dependent DNA ligase [Nanoarchaeota archaeon]|nr:ATP-dependent DNA ligase [Nanoarchaeota archaeon]
MDYKKLVEVYENISKTSKRLSKTYYVSELLKKTKDDEIEKVLLLLNGRIHPAWDKSDMGVAAKLVIKALALASGLSSDKVEKEWKKTGDLGIVAYNLMQNKKQATLFSEKLSVEKVFADLRKLSKISGHGAVDTKTKIISGLLSSASNVEAQYIVRTVLEDMRVGIGDGTVRDSIVWSSVEGLKINYDGDGNKFDYELSDDLLQLVPEDSKNKYANIVEIIQDAYNITNEFAEVVQILRKDGVNGLLKVDVSVGKPIKVMLYPKAKDMEDAFRIVGKPAAFEYKYDGFRIQAHKKNGKVMLFTRRLENVTNQFPDIVKAISENVKGDDFILDSEAVGFDKNGKYLPFQSISQRIKRKYDIERVAKEYPVELNVFDILAKEGKNLLKMGFLKRRKLIECMIKEEDKKIILARQLITDDIEKALDFYQEALKAGEEGVMGKNLEGIYKPGARVGYGVKLKPTMENLDLVIVGAEWGKGKRSGWLSSFHIACRDDDGNLLDIGKVGTGIKELVQEVIEDSSDAEGVPNKDSDESKVEDSSEEKVEVAKEDNNRVTFTQLTELLKPLVIEEDNNGVKVKPEIVIEISYEEIQKSSKYSSGYALRFPRVLRIREDRAVIDISTIDFIEDLYFEQK